MTRGKVGALALICFFVLVIFGLTALWSSKVRALLLSKGVSPETRGYRVALEKGCFQCHGDQGRGGLINPGGKEIPAWQDFSFMMSMESEEELREWILEGAPKRLLTSESFLEERQGLLLRMPAYRTHLNATELEDLVTFYKGISGLVWPKEEKAEKGFSIAKKNGCFHCHGFAGRIDMPNPGSLVGTIPSWNGPNFPELAKNEAETREWIEKGSLARLQSNRIAKHFMGTQALEMPAYEDLLEPEAIDALLAYIQWLRDPKAPGHQVSFEYE